MCEGNNNPVTWFKFYPGDWLCETMGLSPEARGILIQLRVAYWGEVPLKADVSYLLRVAGATAEYTDTLLEVIDRFFSVRDGLLVDEQLDNQIAAAHKRIETLRNNGRKGGRPRGKRPSRDGENNQKVNQMDNQMVNLTKTRRLQDQDQDQSINKISINPNSNILRISNNPDIRSIDQNPEQNPITALSPPSGGGNSKPKSDLPATIPRSLISPTNSSQPENLSSPEGQVGSPGPYIPRDEVAILGADLPDKSPPDKPPPEKHPPDKSSSRDTQVSLDFAAWWTAYPRKVGKGKARQIWRRKYSKMPPVVDHIALVDAWANSQQWQDAQYIPHPSTWLAGERWEDPVPDRAPPLADIYTGEAITPIRVVS